MSHVKDSGPQPDRPEASEPAGPAAFNAPGPEVQTLKSPGRPRLLRRPAIAALQRSLGNRAAVAAVRRRAVLARKAGKGDATPDRVEEVRKALVADKPTEAQAKMRSLENAEEANKVLGSYQKLATSTFGDWSITTAAEILVGKGGSIGKALDWMVDEGTDWEKMSRVIGAATATERAKIKGEEWKKWWVGQLGDKEMAALVKQLPLDLPTKLNWMKAEGTNWDLLKDVILSVKPEERTKVVEDDGLRSLFVSECNDKEMYEAIRLLGGRLRKQMAWLAAEEVPGSWLIARIKEVKDAKELERRDVYHEKSVQLYILEQDHKLRVEIAKLLGGTPDEQMSLFQNDVPINLLTWAKVPSAEWVAAFLKYRKNPLDLLQIASPDPPGWGAVIQPKLWDLVKDFHDVLYPEYRVKVFWEAFGNGSTFSAAQIMHFIGILTGKPPIRGGKKIQDSNYFTRDPTDATARAFMELLKPGGSSGAKGISREELSMGIVAFCSHKWDDNNSTWVDIGTSYFSDPYIIIRVDATGNRDTRALGSDAAGTPWAVGTGMDFFENHARHEIGHAVGARKIGNMKESGNAFAERYGGWKESSREEFEKALWTDVAKPRAGWPSLRILGATVTVTNKDVHDWCLDILDKNKQTANAIGKVAGNLQDKLKVIEGSLWGGVKLVKYLRKVGSTTTADMRDNAFQFPGFTPTDPVQIYSNRWKDGFASYKKDAHDALQNISWYALSSPAEMFAEMYTARYAQKTLPVKVGSADPEQFFTALESQRDAMFGRK